MKNRKSKIFNLCTIKSTDCYILCEKDFYPPEDTRTYESLIEDIEDGDNFDDYAKMFFKCYEKEIFDC